MTNPEYMKTTEELLQELEFFIASRAPSHIIEKAALAVDAARIRDAIDQEALDSYGKTQ